MFRHSIWTRCSGAKDPLYSREKLPATQPVLQRYTKWVQEFLDSKGVKEKIAGTVMPGEAGEYSDRVSTGQTAPDGRAGDVRRQPGDHAGQAAGGDRRGRSGASYTEDSFRQTLNSVIRPLYEKQGYLRVTFPDLRTKPAEDVQGLHVFVSVDEGVTYETGKVTIDGPTPIAPDVLIKAGEFKAGELADMSRVNEGVERVRKTVRREGYMEVRVTAERHLDHQKKLVNVTLRVEAGPQFTMGKLNIVGLDLNSEPEIRRIWILKQGKPFNPEYPDLFLRKIREQGMFDILGATKAEYQLNQKDHTADVTLTFAGKPPGPGRGGRGGRGAGDMKNSTSRSRASTESAAAFPAAPARRGRRYPGGAPAGGPSLRSMPAVTRIDVAAPAQHFQQHAR